jgi:hypothetical protein
MEGVPHLEPTSGGNMTETLIEKFAEKYRVKPHTPFGNKPDRRGIRHGEETLIPGKYGEIAEGTYKPAILEDRESNPRHGMLEIRLTAVPRNADMNKALNGRVKEAEAGGMILYQRNGYESVWGFDPKNEAQCRLAIKLIAPRRKKLRVLSESQKAALATRLRAARERLNASAGMPFPVEIPHVAGHTAV